MAKKETIAIVGAGSLGSALAVALRRAGFRIDELITRDGASSLQRAQALARRVGARAVTLPMARLKAEVLWICVNDDAIRSVAEQLARKGDWRGKLVVHSSGALASDELAPLRSRGAHVGSAHPMMTFVRNAPASFKGITFALEGDAKATAFGRKVAAALGMEAFTIPKESKVLYHATGSFASPMFVALMSFAERVAAAAKVPRGAVPKVIRPILLKTMQNYLAAGTAAAFSGPINRGDLATVRKHLRALKRVPGARKVYVGLASEAAQTLPVKNRAAMLRLLRGR
jgi:predicted short-subunit dehydrogenase-like oxidoreductase (DUF2520 family)